jgi:hypothetical protein
MVGSARSVESSTAVNLARLKTLLEQKPGG